MKKILISTLLLLYATISVFSNSPNKSKWFGTNSGDYVIYKDNSWKEPTWIGFLYYNSNTIGSFLYTANGKTFVKILFSGEESGGEFVITGQNIISQKSNDSLYTYSINYLMELLPKLYSWKIQPKNKGNVIKKSSLTIDEPQFGGKAELRFSSYVPIFCLDRILDKDGKNIFVLEEIGLTDNENDFFNFTPIPDVNIKSSKFSLAKKLEKKEVKIADAVIHLDSQWKQIAYNSFLLDNEAFLSAVPFDLKKASITGDINDFIIKYLCSSGTDVKVIVEKTDISGTNVEFKIKNEVYDIQSKTIKYDIKDVKKIKGTEYLITSLTVNKSTYKKYKKYFDSLF